MERIERPWLHRSSLCSLVVAELEDHRWRSTRIRSFSGRDIPTCRSRRVRPHSTQVLSMARVLIRSVAVRITTVDETKALTGVETAFEGARVVLIVDVCAPILIQITSRIVVASSTTQARIAQQTARRRLRIQAGYQVGRASVCCSFTDIALLLSVDDDSN